MTSAWQRVQTNVFAPNKIDPAGFDDILERSRTKYLRGKLEIIDGHGLRRFKYGVIDRVKPVLSEGAFRFAESERGLDDLKAHGFDGIEDFANVVLKARELDLLYDPAGPQMIQSAKKVFSEAVGDEAWLRDADFYVNRALGLLSLPHSVNEVGGQGLQIGKTLAVAGGIWLSGVATFLAYHHPVEIGGLPLYVIIMGGAVTFFVAWGTIYRLQHYR